MGEQGSVDQADQRVHERLRMDDHFDALVRQVEQMMGFDDLEPFVHEGGGVDRDLLPHGPGGMGQGLLPGDRGQVRRRPAPEGSAGRSDHQRVDRPSAGSRHQLEERRVLGIDRQDGDPPARRDSR